MMSNYNEECAVCYRVKNNEIFVECIDCGLGVHGTCYGCSFTSAAGPLNGWKCRYCHAIKTGAVNGYYNPITKAIKCRICNQCKFGALKSCGKKQGFAHLVCALWTPFIFIENPYNQAPIKGVERCKQYKSVLNKLKCSVCHECHATIKCRFKFCEKYYHPLCLMENYRDCMIENDVNIDESHSSKVYYTYCPDHVHLHKGWNCKEAHKKPKCREIVFEGHSKEIRTNYTNNTNKMVNDNRQTQAADICMAENGENGDDYNNNDDDNDSDVVILSANCCNKPSITANTTPIRSRQKRENKKIFECESNVNVIDIQSDDVSINCLINPLNGLNGLNASFIPDSTPSPSIQMDIASQWTERFGCGRTEISDRDSVVGFNHNLCLREYSPLMMRHEMSPQNVYPMNNGNRINWNGNHYTNIDGMNGMNGNMNINNDQHLLPNLSNNGSGTSTNSTFATIPSPHTVGSHSQISTPRTIINIEHGKFIDVVDVTSE